MTDKKLKDDNLRMTLKLLLSHLGIAYHADWHREHMECVDYPSFMSFHYFLRKKGVRSVALRIDPNEVEQYPVPFMIHRNDGLFWLVDHVEGEWVYFISGEKEQEAVTLDILKSEWNGEALIFDTEQIEILQEPLANKIRKAFSRLKGVMGAGAFVLFLLVCFCCSEERSLYNILLIFYCLIGGGVSLLLVMHQYNGDSGLKRKFCPFSSKSEKLDCSSVLESKAAYCLGLFLWSDLGFIYFLSLGGILLFFPGNLVLSVVIIIVASAPVYVVYSLYFQAFVMKKWCSLCLFVLMILLLGGGIAVFFFRSGLFAINFTLDYLFLLLIPVIVICGYGIISSFLGDSSQMEYWRRRYRMLKHQREVVTTLFEKQPEMITANVQCVVLSPEGNNCITMVFNPVCNPCMGELRKLLEISMRKDDTRIELVLLAFGTKNSDSYIVAKKLLGLLIGGDSDVMAVLRDYTENYQKNLKQLRNIPLSGVREEELDKRLEEYRTWCYLNRITATPTCFFNNRLIPEEYTLDDIDYMCL